MIGYFHFHQKMIISGSDIRVLCLFEGPKSASQIESNYHKVSCKENSKLKHDRHKSRHVLEKGETRFSTNIHRPVLDHDEIHHGSSYRKTDQPVNKRSNSKSRWSKTHGFIKPMNREWGIDLRNMITSLAYLLYRLQQQIVIGIDRMYYFRCHY